MKSSKVLEMLNQNRIEELKAALQDEIFTESLASKPNAKKRYAAMKRYLKTISESRPILTKPCEVEFKGKKYNAFTNSYSIALTTESCGELDMCDEPERYPSVARLITLDGNEDLVDFDKVLADAKSKGYKYMKNSIYSNEYLMQYNGAYFRIGLLDITYGVIADGKPVTVYRPTNSRGQIAIENDIGICMIMPVRIEDLSNSIVIDAK